VLCWTAAGLSDDSDGADILGRSSTLFINLAILLSLFLLFAVPLVFGICLTMYGFGCLCQAISKAVR
jgi:hypothetical protein